MKGGRQLPISFRNPERDDMVYDESRIIVRNTDLNPDTSFSTMTVDCPKMY